MERRRAIVWRDNMVGGQGWKFARSLRNGCREGPMTRRRSAETWDTFSSQTIKSKRRSQVVAQRIQRVEEEHLCNGKQTVREWQESRVSRPSFSSSLTPCPLPLPFPHSHQVFSPQTQNTPPNTSSPPMPLLYPTNPPSSCASKKSSRISSMPKKRIPTWRGPWIRR